jgi:gamma-glutamylputrescine oxidase
VKSYYQASKNLMIEQGSLEGEVRAEVCVIGGGYTGLSSALYLAKKGINVALLEANNLASGASGTNGGQVSGGTASSTGRQAGASTGERSSASLVG